MIEVVDGSNGGQVTGVFEIGHLVAPADLRKPGGFGHEDSRFVGAALVFHSIARGGNAS